jgi:predicted TIM-barrel fold metal-dependent hydrolase
MAQQIFDSHLHIIDPAFPQVLNKGHLPDPFTTSDYLVMTRPFGVKGSAVVSGSFQAFDPHCRK